MQSFLVKCGYILIKCDYFFVKCDCFITNTSFPKKRSLNANCRRSPIVTIVGLYTSGPTCPGEICDIISNFENKTSSGLDEISPKVFKNLTPNLIVSLAHIFNLSLSQGEFINSFKSAKVLPIYKKKDKTDMGNYRPISLLPVASKILEKIMHVRLYSFLNKKGFFYENQFGFRREHSTDQAAIVMTDKVTKALNKNLKVASVFLDMSKAFDCVDHNILLHKLYKCGIRGVAYSWFVSYLTGRYQKVLVNGILSENTCLIKHGVPQGSILGPLLYLIYVNDCNNCLEHSNSILYADKTTLVFVAKTLSTNKLGLRKL